MCVGTLGGFGSVHNILARKWNEEDLQIVGADL
jgi:hypothetical protein